MDPSGAPSPPGPAFVRADVDERRCVPVIRSVEHDHRAPVYARQPECELVGFAHSRNSNVELGRQRRQQFLGVAFEQVMQVARGRVEDAHLRRRRLDNARMTVPDMWNVVIGVDVPPAFVVEEVLHPSTHDLDGIAVRDAEIATDRISARGERLLLRRRRRGTDRVEHARSDLIGTERTQQLVLLGVPRRENRCRDRGDR